VSHILKFGGVVVSYWRCFISFRDTHPPYSHPHLPQEIPHLRIAGYVILLKGTYLRKQNKKFLFLPKYGTGIFWLEYFHGFIG
jgi:hypothetical protein